MFPRYQQEEIKKKKYVYVNIFVFIECSDKK